MKSLPIALLLSVAACATVETDEVHSSAPLPAKPANPANPAAEAQFAALKSMAGTWMFSDPGGGEPAHIDYRVTGGGSAVVETLFPGTEMEMLSVYTLDAGQLHMTHYCMMGNQPHMIAAPAESAERIELVCQGGGNLSDCDADHMHGGAFHFKDAEHVDASWASYSGGQKAHEVTFHLERR